MCPASQLRTDSPTVAKCKNYHSQSPCTDLCLGLVKDLALLRLSFRLLFDRNAKGATLSKTSRHTAQHRESVGTDQRADSREEPDGLGRDSINTVHSLLDLDTQPTYNSLSQARPR